MKKIQANFTTKQAPLNSRPATTVTGHQHLFVYVILFRPFRKNLQNFRQSLIKLGSDKICKMSANNGIGKTCGIYK